MLKIGTRVKFKEVKSNTIPAYECDPFIPRELLKHGSTLLGEDYKKNGAIIKEKYGQYYLVEYIDGNNEPVCLGFTEDQLIPISWKARYEKGN